MNSPRQRQLLLALITLVAIVSTVLVATARSQAFGRFPEAWVGTWATALHKAPGVDSGFPDLSTKGFKDQTIRMVVHTSVGGSKVRARLSNRFGDRALLIGHATIGLPMTDAGPGDLRAGTIHEASFNGQRSVTIPPGGSVLTDPITMDIAWLGDVAVSLYLPGPTGPPTLHNLSRATSYIGPGDNAGAPSGATMSTTFRSWWYLAAIDVLNRSGAGTIAVVGDSITDGNGSTNNTNHRWTNFLANRLNQRYHDRSPGVLNLAMGGNRLLHDGTDFQHPEFGVAASARFADDVLGQAGIRAVIVELGINDIWISHDNAEQIIAQLQQLAARAHQAGLEIFVCTLGPWKGLVGFTGAVVYTATLDSIRLAVNSYLRTTTDFDGVIDMDMVLRSEADPLALRTEYESKAFPDHIHPNDDGNQALANSVNLNMLEDS